MIKVFKTFLAIMAVAMVFASCSKDNNEPVVPTQQEIEAKIIGQWKVESYSGKEYTTNQQTIYTFRSDGTFTVSASKPIRIQNGQHYWANKVKLPYSMKGNNIFVTGIEGNNLSINVLRISDTSMEVTEQGEHAHTLTKIAPNNYANDIIGMWEGVSMTGDETYGNAEARIAYHADGTFTYYRKYADVWFPSDDVSCEYNVDGDWLATRWQAEEGGEYNYEWWDIDEIKDGTMKWSALRERADGSRYTTTFTWKKVNVLMDDELRAKVMGNWKAMGATAYYFKEGKFVGKEDYSPVPGQTISVTEDNMFHIINIDEDGQPYAIGGWNFTIKGNVVTTVLTECPYPNLIGQTHRYVWFFMEGDTFYFAIYDDEDDPDYDHSLFVSRYQR